MRVARKAVSRAVGSSPSVVGRLQLDPKLWAIATVRQIGGKKMHINMSS